MLFPRKFPGFKEISTNWKRLIQDDATERQARLKGIRRELAELRSTRAEAEKELHQKIAELTMAYRRRSGRPRKWQKLCCKFRK